MKTIIVQPKPELLRREFYIWRMPKGSTRRLYESQGFHPNYPGVLFDKEIKEYYIDRSQDKGSYFLVKDKNYIGKFDVGYAVYKPSLFRKTYDVIV